MSHLRLSGRPRREPWVELRDVGGVGLVAEGGDVRRRVPLLFDHPPVDGGEETVRLHRVRPRGPQPLLHAAPQQFPDDDMKETLHLISSFLDGRGGDARDIKPACYYGAPSTIPLPLNVATRPAPEFNWIPSELLHG